MMRVCVEAVFVVHIFFLLHVLLPKPRPVRLRRWILIGYFVLSGCVHLFLGFTTSFPLHPAVLEPDLHLHTHREVEDLRISYIHNVLVEALRHAYTLTCVSVSISDVATSKRLGRERYLLSLNCFSSSRSCWLVNAVRGLRHFPINTD